MSDNDRGGCLVAAVLLAVILPVFGLWGWYKAAVQAEVYRREGIQMSAGASGDRRPAGGA